MSDNQQNRIVLAIVFAFALATAVSQRLARQPDVLEIASKYEALYQRLDASMSAHQARLLARIEASTNAMVIKNCNLTSLDLSQMLGLDSNRFVMITGCTIGAK